MNQLPVLNFQDFIATEGEQLTTDSHKVAVVFGKPHYMVMRRIRELMADLSGEHGDFFALMQIHAGIGNGATRLDPAYRITRDGFALLAMGFTGKKAFAFKVAYIKAFNAMELYIKNQRDGLRYRCMEKELECRDSARRGSFHGKGLNLRKQEKPTLEAELAALLSMAQPPLLSN